MRLKKHIVGSTGQRSSNFHRLLPYQARIDPLGFHGHMDQSIGSVNGLFPPFRKRARAKAVGASLLRTV